MTSVSATPLRTGNTRGAVIDTGAPIRRPQRAGASASEGRSGGASRRFGDVYLALALWRSMGLEELCERLRARNAPHGRRRRRCRLRPGRRRSTPERQGGERGGAASPATGSGLSERRNGHAREERRPQYSQHVPVRPLVNPSNRSPSTTGPIAAPNPAAADSEIVLTTTWRGRGGRGSPCSPRPSASRYRSR